MSNKLVMEGISKSFRVNETTMQVLNEINLTIAEGEFVAIVGHSGCGKSTLLKIIAGLEKQDSGTCTMDGRLLVGTSPQRGMIFQEHRLFPWLTITQNVQLGMEKRPKNERQEIAEEYLAMVKLADFKNAYPHQLSGGMAQRAAIARTLVTQPEVLLLDEPFGALDALTKMEMQEEILRIRNRYQSTMIMVTHDIEEAVFLADKVVVMSARPGTIQEVIPIALGSVRNRTDSDFAWYKRRILQHFLDEKSKDVDYTI